MNIVPAGVDWTEIAADISTMTLLQILGKVGDIVELEASADAPTAPGKVFTVGDTIISTRIPDIGAAGKLWARSQGNVAVSYE
jgi:hypothetical protein